MVRTSSRPRERERSTVLSDIITQFSLRKRSRQMGAAQGREEEGESREGDSDSSSWLIVDNDLPFYPPPLNHSHFPISDSPPALSPPCISFPLLNFPNYSPFSASDSPTTDPWYVLDTAVELFTLAPSWLITLEIRAPSALNDPAMVDEIELRLVPLPWLWLWLLPLPLTLALCGGLCTLAAIFLNFSTLFFFALLCSERSN